jgi:hypothetical protein
MDCWEINEHTLEYFDDEHLYLVDGIEVPSITEILKIKFGNKYSNVNSDVLKKASEKGTQVHNAIEKYCKTGEKENLKEVKNFIFLQKKYDFEVLENEVPVILFYDNKPVCAGRLDLVLKFNGEIGGADIKRTSALDKEYLAYQLNLYRIAYRQCYGVEWKFLKGIHLREDKRKFIDIPINEEMVLNLVKEYLEMEGNNE